MGPATISNPKLRETSYEKQEQLHNEAPTKDRKHDPAARNDTLP
jgi:hypothetical protein